MNLFSDSQMFFGRSYKPAGKEGSGICLHCKQETPTKDLFLHNTKRALFGQSSSSADPLRHTCAAFSSSLLKRWAEPPVSAVCHKNHATGASS